MNEKRENIRIFRSYLFERKNPSLTVNYKSLDVFYAGGPSPGDYPSLNPVVGVFLAVIKSIKTNSDEITTKIRMNLRQRNLYLYFSLIKQLEIPFEVVIKFRLLHTSKRC